MCERWLLPCGCGDSDVVVVGGDSCGDGESDCGGDNIGDSNSGGGDDGGGLYCCGSGDNGGGGRGGGGSWGEPTYSQCVGAANSTFSLPCNKSFFLLAGNERKRGNIRLWTKYIHIYLFMERERETEGKNDMLLIRD